ncbi:MAG: sensor histidine kinase [Stappiaceae bacterium]
MKLAFARKSLALRLIALASIWLMVALVVAGIFIVTVYWAASERSFDRRIDVYMKALIAAMADGEVIPKEPERLGEPSFELPLSGWYWTVRKEGDKMVTFSSLSLLGDSLVVSNVGQDIGQLRDYGIGPASEEVRILQERINFGHDHDYIIAIAGRTDGLRREVWQFAWQVALTLIVLGTGLVGTIFLQVRVGLKPLARMSASLAAVRRGDEQRVDEDLPSEIAPLASELNALIVSNREIVERSRTHVGNLAHALKTPLSVITNEAAPQKSAFGKKVAEQAALMRDQINHHLERARMAAQRRVIGISTDVEPVVKRLVRAMTRIHEPCKFSESIVGTDRFRGEQQDLEEILGNLMDNAGKWAKSEVRIGVSTLREGENERASLVFTIEDDGPGLTEKQMLEARKRGKRLDETVPGSGLGLSIVADLTALYGGEFDLRASPLGGLQAVIVLPAI